MQEESYENKMVEVEAVKKKPSKSSVIYTAPTGNQYFVKCSDVSHFESVMGVDERWKKK